MPKIILQHPHSGIIKTAPVGFSFTTLFFGPLPALFRGDLKWFIIQFLVFWMFIPGLIFACIYNKLYLRQMLERGYKVKSVEGATIEALNTQLSMELPRL